MFKPLSEQEVNNRLDKLNLKLIDQYKTTKVNVRLLCYCGNIFKCKLNSVFCGDTNSCGCYQQKRASESLLIDLTKQTFERLYVKKLLPKEKGKERYYLCECSCGNTAIISGHSLSTKNSRSCGCLQKEIVSGFTGKNNPHYNINLTDEERNKSRCLDNKNYEWIKQIFIRDEYTCQICGQNGNINAHHLYGYHWCEKGRYNLDNGVTLCKDCHKDFHYIYGNMWNTREEFIEYQERWI